MTDDLKKLIIIIMTITYIWREKEREADFLGSEC